MDIDVARVLGTVTRTHRTIEKGGRPAAVVTLSRTYDTDVDDLWDAVTTPDRIARWFLPVEGELKLGGRYQLKGNAGGTVTACSPPEQGSEGSFSATWEFGGGISWIDVSVRPDGEMARLTLDHIAPIEPHWDKYGPGAAGIGWDLGLIGLDLYLAGGAAAKAVDPKLFEAWSMSPDGQAFVRGSGESWRAAHVAGGADAADAKIRSDRTISFYTGQPEPD